MTPGQEWHNPDAPLCKECGHVEDQPHCQMMTCECVGFYASGVAQ